MESNQDKKELNDTPLNVHSTIEGDTILIETTQDIEKGKVFEFDFDITKLNLPKIIGDIKCPKTLSKIKQKIDAKLKKKDKTKEEKEDMEEDLTTDKTEIRDGQKVTTEAEGDDDDAEGKIEGDKYNQQEKFNKNADGDPSKKQKKEKKKMDMETLKDFFTEKFTALEEDLKKRDANVSQLEAILKDFVEKQKQDNEIKAHALRETLSRPPYSLPRDSLKDKTLDMLETDKATFDKLPMIKDYHEEQEDAFENYHATRLTHEDVEKLDFDTMDMDQPIDKRALVFKEAQNKFKIATDFGGNRKK